MAGRPDNSLKKSLLSGAFKNSKCKEQKKFKVDAYLDIRESLKFLMRRSNWKIFNALIRIISARKALRHEVKNYEGQI